MPDQVGFQQVANQPLAPPVLTKGEVEWSGGVQPRPHVPRGTGESVSRVKNCWRARAGSLPPQVELGVKPPPLDPVLPAQQEEGCQDGQPQDEQTRPSLGSSGLLKADQDYMEDDRE